MSLDRETVRIWLKDWSICKDILNKLKETGQVYIVDHDIPLSVSKHIFYLLDKRRREEADRLGVPQVQYEFEDILWKLLGEKI